MKHHFKLFMICFFALASKNAIAQNKIQSFMLRNNIVNQYERADWDIGIQASFENPYLQEDIALDMELQTPAGKKLILPCFYDAESPASALKWRARFLPQESGKYTYRFILKKEMKVVTQSKSSSFVAHNSTKRGIMHKNNLWTFKFDNGELYRGLGENICWESRANDDSKFFKELHEKEKYNYEYLLPALQKHGGDYFRTWICSWNLPIDWKSGFNNNRYQKSEQYYNPGAIQKFDRLVNLSDSLGIYMMLTLGEGSHDEKNGRFHVSTPDFFINPKAKDQYKNRLRFIVARWGYSPSIGAWEFFNEIDNVQFRIKDKPIDPAHIVSWHDEMSTYLKNIDPYQHLVTTSISHRDLEGLNSVKNIDFNQKHIYKNNHALAPTILKYSQDFKKPYVIGEFGYEYDWQKNFNLFADEMDSDFKRGLWYGLFSPTPVLPLSWWWEFFDDRGTDAYLRKVRTIRDEMISAGNGNFEHHTAVASNNNVEIYSIKCGDKVFVYLYNPKAEKAETNIEFDLTSGNTEGRSYDCESGNYAGLSGELLNGNVKIKNITLQANSDQVLIF